MKKALSLLIPAALISTSAFAAPIELEHEFTLKGIQKEIESNGVDHDGSGFAFGADFTLSERYYLEAELEDVSLDDDKGDLKKYNVGAGVIVPTGNDFDTTYKMGAGFGEYELEDKDNDLVYLKASVSTKTAVENLNLKGSVVYNVFDEESDMGYGTEDGFVYSAEASYDVNQNLSLALGLEAGEFETSPYAGIKVNF